MNDQNSLDRIYNFFIINIIFPANYQAQGTRSLFAFKLATKNHEYNSFYFKSSFL